MELDVWYKIGCVAFKTGGGGLSAIPCRGYWYRNYFGKDIPEMEVATVTQFDDQAE